MAHKLGRAKRLAYAVALLLLVGWPALAFAQAAGPPSGAPPSPEEQFAQLKQRLAITPAQETRFDALVQVMRQNTATRDAFVARNPPSQRRNALGELRVQAEAASLDARGLQHLLPAFQALYTSLSPEQKAAADQAFAPPPQGPPGQMPPQR
jgi:periplasmic protein CpxP/Spy